MYKIAAISIQLDLQNQHCVCWRYGVLMWQNRCVICRQIKFLMMNNYFTQILGTRPYDNIRNFTPMILVVFIRGNHCELQYIIIKYALSRTTHLWSSAKLGFCMRPTGWYVPFLSLSSLIALLWRHNGCHGVSNHQSRDCLLNRLFRHRWKKTSKLCVTGLCAGNSPVAGEFPAQRASNAENVFIWWRHHVTTVGTGRLKHLLHHNSLT